MRIKTFTRCDFSFVTSKENTKEIVSHLLESSLSSQLDRDRFLSKYMALKMSTGVFKAVKVVRPRRGLSVGLKTPLDLVTSSYKFNY